MVVIVTGVVRSENYPRHNNNVRETQRIQVPQGMILSLQFTDFDMECCCDYLTVTDGDGTLLMGRRAGSSLPPNIISRTNVVKLYFFTDYSVTRRGWSIEWRLIGPGLENFLRKINQREFVWFRDGVKW